MKKYIAPATDTIDMSIYDNLLDWEIGSPIGEGDGDVDAKVYFLDDEFDNKEGLMEMDLHFDVWK